MPEPTPDLVRRVAADIRTSADKRIPEGRQARLLNAVADLLDAGLPTLCPTVDDCPYCKPVVEVARAWDGGGS